MGFKRVVTEVFRQQKTKEKKVKKDHKAKSWATLNTNAKFEIIGDDLIARGIIQA